MMKVTVCQISDDDPGRERDWEALAAHVAAQKSQLVLLPELPFHAWFARQRLFNPDTWQATVLSHQTWLSRLAELAPAAVLATRPVEQDGLRLNEGFAWNVERGYRTVHHKYYLPDDEGFWEASWYQRGSDDFTPLQLGSLKIGFLICSELWFAQRARAYGKQGVHLLVTPRCTMGATTDKWLAGGRAAAVAAGAYGLSSNHVSPPDDPLGLGGRGWIINPDGDVLGVTSPEYPFLTVEIDPAEAEHAKTTYPRYIPD